MKWIALCLILTMVTVCWAGAIPPYVTPFMRTVNDDATQAAARTTLGVGTGDSPTFAGLALGAGNITMTGSIGATGARVTKGWFTDLECTNAMVGGLISLSASSGVLIKNFNGVTVASFGLGGADSLNVGLLGNTVNTGNFTKTDNCILGTNSAVFQPTADSTTFFQVLDADGGVPVLNVDSTNERVGIGTASPGGSLEIYNATVGTNFLEVATGTTDAKTPLRIKAVTNGANDEPIFETPAALQISSTLAGVTSKFRLLPYEDDIYFQNSETAGDIIFTGLNGADLTGVFRFKGQNVNIVGRNPNIIINGTDTATYRLIEFQDNATPKGAFQQIGSTYVDVDYRDALEFISYAAGGPILFITNAFATAPVRLALTKNGEIGFFEIAPETAIEFTNIAPYFTFHNDTHEDAAGGRESRIIAKGEQSGGEETTLGYMEFAHDGAADDEKGYWKLYTNDGSDGTSPTLALTVDSSQNATFAKFDQWSVTATITAVTPGVQGDGALTTTVNEVSTVANANDAVTLPAAVVGRHVIIINNGANTLEIWPASGDNAGGGVDTAVTLAAGSNVHYVAYNGTNWESI